MRQNALRFTNYLSISELSRRSGVSRYLITRGIESGAIPFINCGKRRLVPADALERSTRLLSASVSPASEECTYVTR